MLLDVPLVVTVQPTLCLAQQKNLLLRVLFHLLQLPNLGHGALFVPRQALFDLTHPGLQRHHIGQRRLQQAALLFGATGFFDCFVFRFRVRRLQRFEFVA